MSTLLENVYSFKRTLFWISLVFPYVVPISYILVCRKIFKSHWKSPIHGNRHKKNQSTFILNSAFIFLFFSQITFLLLSFKWTYCVCSLEITFFLFIYLHVSRCWNYISERFHSTFKWTFSTFFLTPLLFIK